jgi:peptide-methionine (R)-S-oxide reductase
VRNIFLFALIIQIQLASCQNSSDKTKIVSTNKSEKIMTEEEWKKKLTSEQFHVLREKGTERPHTGKYNLHFEKGIFTCAGCGEELFQSDQKFESHCGWPSFDGEIGTGNKIKKIKDLSFGMNRTEIVCANCGGHLGHIFDDGPTKTGLRYCVNSLSIDFIEEKKD